MFTVYFGYALLHFVFTLGGGFYKMLNWQVIGWAGSKISMDGQVCCCCAVGDLIRRYFLFFLSSRDDVSFSLSLFIFFFSYSSYIPFFYVYFYNTKMAEIRRKLVIVGDGACGSKYSAEHLKDGLRVLTILVNSPPFFFLLCIV